MSFSMSGGTFSYNRFDKHEDELKEAKGYQEGGEVTEDCEDGTCGKCPKCKKKKEGKKSSSAKPDYLDVDKDGDKEEDMKDAIEDNGGAVSEGMLPLPTEKIKRQANKAYTKEVIAAKSGDEKETNKQMYIAEKVPKSKNTQQQFSAQNVN